MQAVRLTGQPSRTSEKALCLAAVVSAVSMPASLTVRLSPSASANALIGLGTVGREPC